MLPVSGYSCSNNRQVLLTTWLGTFFDGMDASIFVLALFPTLSELMHTHSHAAIGVGASIALATFMIGWAAGSAVFGFLADKIGRVSTMIATILLYAIATGLCATSHSLTELAIYRFFVGCGIGGEISVGAVLLAECWRGNSRYGATGILCTSFGFGYLATALLNFALGGLGWRWLYLVGMIPALLTIYIRLKLKESAQFEAAEAERKTEQPDRMACMRKLLAQENRQKLVCVISLATACIVGYWAVLSWIPAWINQLVGTNAVNERSTAAVVLNIGSILGAVIFGVYYDKFGQRNAFRFAFVGALVSCVLMFLTVKSYGLPLLGWVFAVGLLVEAPFVPLFIYVPELFSVDMRATAFGVGVQSGRLFAAAAALMAGQLIALFGGSYAIAGACVASVYVVGIAATFFMPRTTGVVLEKVQKKPVVRELVGASARAS